MDLRCQIQKALERAETLGGKEGLNCIAELDGTALEQVKSLTRQAFEEKHPAFGMPVLIKDNIDVKGLHTTAGSLALADNVAKEDAPVVRNLRRNGVIILGKTNMTEFANYTAQGMPNGYSSLGGQVVHCANPSLDPSGSSSGSGVAVAAGIVPAAVGTDTSFSIIACAQANGICGIKPPVGVLPAEGIIPIARTLDSAGVLARNMTDALKLYSAMRDGRLPILESVPVDELRIAVNTANRGNVSEGQTAFLSKLLSLLPPIKEIEQKPTMWQKVIMQWEFRPHLEDYLRTSSATCKTLQEIVACYETHPDTMMKYGIFYLKQALDETPGGLGGAPYLEAMMNRQEMIRQIKTQIEPFDAVLMTGPTNVMHFCGLPSVTVAGRQTNEYGVRRCVILYGADEYRLYSAALTIERLLNE